MAGKNILEAILEALPAIGEGLQETGIGVSAITGEATQAQTISALETLQKLKKGRLDAASQKEMAVEFEKMMRQPGKKQSITREGSEFKQTVSTPDLSQQTSKSALAYAASQDPTLAQNPVIRAYLGIGEMAPQESFLPAAETARQNRLNAPKIPQTPYKLETEMKTVKGVAVPQQKKTMLTITDRNAIMKAAAAESQSSRNEDIKLSYNRILKELGYIIPSEDIPGTKGGMASFETVDEAERSGLPSGTIILIGGKRARIN